MSNYDDFFAMVHEAVDNGDRSAVIRLGIARGLEPDQAKSWAGVLMGDWKTNVRPPESPSLIIKPSTRHAIYERDGYICQYCGTLTYQNPNEDYSWCTRNIDHIIPRSFFEIHPRGIDGINAPENLVTSCRRCNILAGDRIFDDFEDKKRWIQSQLHVKEAEIET